MRLLTWPILLLISVLKIIKTNNDVSKNLYWVIFEIQIDLWKAKSIVNIIPAQPAILYNI